MRVGCKDSTSSALGGEQAKGFYLSLRSRKAVFGTSGRTVSCSLGVSF